MSQIMIGGQLYDIVLMGDPATGLPVAGSPVNTGQLPASLGPKPSAASLSVAPSSDGVFAVTGPLTDAQLRAAAVPVTAGQISSVSATIARTRVPGWCSAAAGAMAFRPVRSATARTGWAWANISQRFRD